MKSISLVALLFAAVISTSTVNVAGQEIHDHSHDQNAQGPEKPGMGMAMMQNCAMNLQGADLQISDTPDGVRVAITTKSGDVTELRTRVEAMAKMHSASSSSPMMQGQMSSFTVKYEEIPNGALLTFTPKDAAQLNEFREQVRSRAEQMKKGDCSMMQSMMQGMMDGMTGMKNSETIPKAVPKPAEADHSEHHPTGDGR